MAELHEVSIDSLRSRESAAALPSAQSAPRPEVPAVHTNSPVWLAQRALLALGLMIGFYLLAVMIALTLLWVPYAEATYIGRIHFKLTAVCVLAGLSILWSLVPRIDRFTPPGPRLDESAHPRLFDVIRRVATATGQSAPAEVYLLNEVNAWVTHRGGVMGFGSRRVMGVGLPLVQAVSVAELEAIIAHEFGHYCAGDVKLGPWIYKTRAAIGRTIAGLGDTLVAAPFLWYGGHFLRLTHAISRQQEFIADRTAAGVAGAAAMSSALKRVSTAAPLFSAYLKEEVGPVLNAGYLPPVSAGFKEFLGSRRIGVLSAELLARAEAAEETDLFDTHPCLRDRLAALHSAAAVKPATAGTEPAAVLLGNPDAHTRALLEAVAGADAVRQLKPIEWDQVGSTVYTTRWRELVQRHSAWLSRFTTDTLPAGKDAFIHAGSDLVRAEEQNIDGDQRAGRAAQLIGIALGVLLLDDGWQVHTRPGLPLTFDRDSRTFDPFATADALLNGRLSGDAWRSECEALGLTGRPLHRTQQLPL